MDCKTSSLESMCELIVDCPHSTPTWTDAGFIVLRNQNIRNGRLDLSSPSFTDEAGYQSRIKRAVPQAGDIVFTREAPMGEVCLIPEGLKCCLGQRQVLLRPKKNVDGEYLYWALQSPFVKHQISWNEGTGTTVSNVRIPVLKSLEIPRRGDDETTVATILSSLSNKVRLNTETNQTLEQIAQAIFKSWFVDFEPVKAKISALAAGGTEEDALLAAMQAISGKDKAQLTQLQTENSERYNELRTTAELFPSAMQDSELGEIPEGWQNGVLADIARFSKDKIATSELTVATYISTENMVENKKGITEASTISSASSVPKFSPKQVLVSNIRPYFKKIWFANKTGGRSPDVLGFESKTSDSEEFLYNTLFQDYFFEYMMLTSKGAKMPRGDKKAIMQFPVVIPCSNIMRAFCQRVKPFYIFIAENNQECLNLESLRDTLLPHLLSGQLSVHS